MYKALVISLILLLVSGCNALEEPNTVSQVCFGKDCFQVEVADTDSERQVWLMYRDSLVSQSGMLFVFYSSYPHGFWMKNTLIPLDMIWIDEDKKIVDIQTAVPCDADPCPSYVPSGSAKYVLEINAGGADRYDLDTGDAVDFI